MLPLTIAVRFLRSARAQTLLIIAGIGVGIAVQIFVGSLITSLQADLVDSTVGSSPHITIVAGDSGPIASDVADMAASEPEVTAAIPVRRMSALYVEGESIPLSITGGDATALDSIYGLDARIMQGSYSLDADEILVGTRFAEKTGLEVGDTIRLVLLDGNTAEYRLTGVFDLGAAAANERLA